MRGELSRTPLKRGPVERTCQACGATFTVRYPSQARKACSPVCLSEIKSRAKRGDANPMRRPEARAKLSATQIATRTVREADVPGARPTECARPGCANPLGKQATAYCSPSCHYSDRARAGGSQRREQPYHRCAACGVVFAWNGRGRGVYCSLACGRTSGPRPGAVEVVEVTSLRGYRRSDWNAVDLGECEHPDCKARAVARHHVVYRQHVERAKGDRWDPTNMLRLCWAHHGSLHARGDFPLVALPSAALAFAGCLLGPAAYDYLRRRYAGEDPRVDALLTVEATP